MSEYTLYIDDKEYCEYKYFNKALSDLKQNIDSGYKLEIYSTYRVADSEKKCKSELHYKFYNEKEGKKRIEEYWKVHKEEREILEAKKDELENAVIAVNSDLSRQLEKLKKDLNEIQLAADINSLDDRINSLNKQIQTLGFFRGKEKKILRIQLDRANEEQQKAQDSLKSKQAAIYAKQADARKKADAQISEIKKQIESINKEFSKIR